jgi:hypothetical protein
MIKAPVESDHRAVLIGSTERRLSAKSRRWKAALAEVCPAQQGTGTLLGTRPEQVAAPTGRPRPERINRADLVMGACGRPWAFHCGP